MALEGDVEPAGAGSAGAVDELHLGGVCAAQPAAGVGGGHRVVSVGALAPLAGHARPARLAHAAVDLICVPAGVLGVVQEGEVALEVRHLPQRHAAPVATAQRRQVRALGDRRSQRAR